MPQTLAWSLQHYREWRSLYVSVCTKTRAWNFAELPHWSVWRKYLILSGKKELAVGWGGGGLPNKKEGNGGYQHILPILTVNAFIILTEIVTDISPNELS
jgi:hypothetical protein